MSSRLQATPAPTGYRASELQRYLAWSPRLLGVLVALIGFILAIGGAYLAALGGSAYYVVAGAMLLASGYLMIKGRIAGLYVYAGAFAVTCVWAFWEVGLSGWQLIPRLVGPFVLLVLAVVAAPVLDQTTGRRARAVGLVSTGVFIAALAILIPIFNQAPPAHPLPEARADAFFGDPAYAPKAGECGAYGGGHNAQRYSELAQITPANVKDLKRVWNLHTGVLSEKY